LDSALAPHANRGRAFRHSSANDQGGNFPSAQILNESGLDFKAPETASASPAQDNSPHIELSNRMTTLNSISTL